MGRQRPEITVWTGVWVPASSYVHLLSSQGLETFLFFPTAPQGHWWFSECSLGLQQERPPTVAETGPRPPCWPEPPHWSPGRPPPVRSFRPCVLHSKPADPSTHGHAHDASRALGMRQLRAGTASGLLALPDSSHSPDAQLHARHICFSCRFQRASPQALSVLHPLPGLAGPSRARTPPQPGSARCPLG